MHALPLTVLGEQGAEPGLWNARLAAAASRRERSPAALVAA